MKFINSKFCLFKITEFWINNLYIINNALKTDRKFKSKLMDSTEHVIFILASPLLFDGQYIKLLGKTHPHDNVKRLI